MLKSKRKQLTTAVKYIKTHKTQHNPNAQVYQTHTLKKDFWEPPGNYPLENNHTTTHTNNQRNTRNNKQTQTPMIPIPI